MEKLSKNEVMAFMEEMCAPWVKMLNLNLENVADKEAIFIWKAEDDICREVLNGDKIVSGQATMAVADTASFLTICAMNNQLMNCTTVDMSTNFMRPLFAGSLAS